MRMLLLASYIEEQARNILLFCRVVSVRVSVALVNLNNHIITTTRLAPVGVMKTTTQCHVKQQENGC